MSTNFCEFTSFLVTNMYPICVAGALNPCGHYISSMGTGQLNVLRSAFERMTDGDTVAEALSEAQILCVKGGSFSSPLAQKMAVDGKTSTGMYIQLHLLASHVLTSKLMTCSHHLQLHGGKCLATPHLHFRSFQ
jgi:hypothetical protein